MNASRAILNYQVREKSISKAMSGFTFTAPFITPEEEQAELEALTMQERRRLDAEIYGTPSPDDEIEETPELLQRTSILLRDALDLIPDKEEYMEAVRRVPQLVADESPEISFLRCEHWNAWAAASRLAQYWKIRILLFGAERAFLPMTLDGAMAEDAEYLKKAFAFGIGEDDHGRPVLFWDRVRSVKIAATRESVARCVFYNLQRVAALPKWQRRGYVVLVDYMGYDLYKSYDRVFTKRLASIINAAPTAFLAGHMFVGSGSRVLELVMPIIKQMIGKGLRLRIFVHAGAGVNVLDQVQQYGLNGSHIEVMYGGLPLRLSLAAKWTEEQKTMESCEDQVGHSYDE